MHLGKLWLIILFQVMSCHAMSCHFTLTHLIYFIYCIAFLYVILFHVISFPLVSSGFGAIISCHFIPFHFLALQLTPCTLGCAARCDASDTLAYKHR